jgi:hypothetical protein
MKTNECPHNNSVSRWVYENDSVVKASGYCNDCKWNLVYSVVMKKWIKVSRFK